MNSEQLIELTDKFGAHNYLPLPIVLEKGEGIYVYDTEGEKYTDMLSAYSALNHGHRHPAIIDALIAQANKITLTSRAFHSDQLAIWYEKLAAISGKNAILPMNTGAEAVESAIKIARKWGYDTKGVAQHKAHIIGCSGNFHGRTLGALSLSSEEAYKTGFTPLLDGFSTIPYGDAKALERAITPQTVAFIVEPIQGEAGIILPPDGYLKQVEAICKAHNVLFICDEIQTGLGRTGKMFAFEWEHVEPDVIILGKALGGGVLPISAVLSDASIMNVLTPGTHGSTFGGNPLACAVSVASIDVIQRENLVENSKRLGDFFIEQLKTIQHPAIVDVRGRGLFIGIELNTPARPFCEALAKHGLLCKETHDYVIRFAPPLIITKTQLEDAFRTIQNVFNELA